MKVLATALSLILVAAPAIAKEYHVSITGHDTNPGTEVEPFRTISAAALIAEPGDTVTVHAGVYRERINPPRGGSSDTKRIVYQAAKGEKAVLKGSEIVKGWKKLQNDTWQVRIPNSLFGQFNPFGDLIRGDWFWPKDRDHHTGAVYLDGHWLAEAAEKDEALAPFGNPKQKGEQTLFDVSWLQLANGGKRIAADSFSAHSGIQTIDCDEGEKCVGRIEDGDWVQFNHVDFGKEAEQVALRVESLSIGGIIELRLDSPQGELLGTASVPAPGGRTSWTSSIADIKPVSGIKKLCLVFKDPKLPVSDGLWFAEVNDENTTIWAQFKGVDPNTKDVEINVRQSVFYPQNPSINYITVRGFTLEQAATPWAPPTAEQIGLIGTHWSKGWVIEDNTIRYSISTCLTLGKHGDEFDNTSANSSKGYVETITRGFAAGWSKENIGSHMVRNNHISHCEQAGIVGSMGAVFSTITGNEIHDIHVRRLFTGAEMGGIKIHAPIDTLISNNHIYRAKNRGIWLDWMTQGARVTGNLLHDNGTENIKWSESWEAIAPGGESDMFIEVNHGPILIDNNIFLSPYSVNNRSQGVVFAHNIFAGAFRIVAHDDRQTPFHKAHSTEIVDLHENPSGDNHYYNNIFVEHSDLGNYDTAQLPVTMEGNVYLNGASASKHEMAPLIQPMVDPALEIMERPDGWYLQVTFDKTWADLKGPLVTSGTLGKAIIPDLPYEQPDGTPYRLDRDYFGNERNTGNPYPGPFIELKDRRQTIKVWPRK
ncbi:MAG: hypothetical protein DRI24_08105 [Deltaproteobacteria bacterium]|nr:MAG: hypothetical protein DRI24_08105 [Deltaproteobacteria bacterium]